MIKLKLILVMAVIAFVLYSIQPFMGSVLKIKNEEMTTQQYVTVNSQQKEIVIEMEAYLVGVVAAEMPVSFELEALKAQAIASRTFVASRNYFVDDTTMTQVYQDDEKLKEKWKEQYDANISKIRQAVIETEGQVLKYKNELISATFFLVVMEKQIILRIIGMDRLRI